MHTYILILAALASFAAVASARVAATGSPEWKARLAIPTAPSTAVPALITDSAELESEFDAREAAASRYPYRKYANKKSHRHASKKKHKHTSQKHHQHSNKKNPVNGILGVIPTLTKVKGAESAVGDIMFGSLDSDHVSADIHYGQTHKKPKPTHTPMLQTTPKPTHHTKLCDLNSVYYQDDGHDTDCGAFGLAPWFWGKTDGGTAGIQL